LWDELVALCRSDEVVAVGEAGLDYYYDHSPRDIQQEVFRRQCRLAIEVKKPLVVHVRDAHAECQDILKSEGVGDGVIHCFSGNVDDAKKYIELGFHLSISGIVTYKKTEALGEAVRWAPLDRLLVETDSPYLAPVPYRGKKNEPAFVVETGKKVAELKSIDPADVAEATSRNAASVFGFGS
jgi:TatD DNase family protein